MAVVRLYPYRTAGPIELTATSPDGNRFDAPVLVESAGTDCSLALSARLPADLADVVAPGVAGAGRGDASAGSVRVLARLRSRSSQLREAVDLTPDDGASARLWAGPVDLAVDDWFGRVSIDVVIVLAESVEPSPGLAAERGSVLAWSEPVLVSFGEIVDRSRGRHLSVEWRSFSEGDDWLRTHRTHLFALEPSDPPVLWLNTDVAGAYRILTARGRHGIRARVRDVTYVQIAHQVWSSLLTASFTRLADHRTAGLGGEGGVAAIHDLGGWYGSALLDWLPVLYPGLDADAAADELLEDVATPIADELLMRRVATATQTKIRTADRFEGILRDAMLQEARA